MDRNRFDALTRLLGREGSRRAALGAALSAAILGTGLRAGAKKKNRKKKKNPPQTCFGTLLCEFPGPALDFENCDFSGQDVCEGADCSGSNFRRADLSNAELDDGNFQGASFRDANLRGADLEDSDLSGASFRDACLVGATFFGANVDGAHFGGAIFCSTTLSDGTVDNSGCDDGTNCCPTDGCFDGVECEGTCCEFPCSCVEAVPGPGDACADLDVGDCDFPCTKDPDCPVDWVCVDDGFCGFDHCHPVCGAIVVEGGSANRGRSHRG
ncbi:MAG: pentapeptide repeat-containing protein [Thermomicrobiales bacterium]